MENCESHIFLLNTIAMNTSQMPKPDFLDILFNSRNKDYGAYDLRRRYDRRVRNAVASMAGLVLVSVGSYLWATNSKAGDVNIKPYVAPIELKTVEMPPEEKPITPPPTVKTPPPAAVASVKYVTPDIVKDDKVKPEDELQEIEDLKKDVAIGTKTQAGEPGEFENPFEGTGGTGTVVEAPKVEKEQGPLSFVEIMPQFQGGEDAMNKWLNNNIRYPHAAEENGIEGTVFVKFVVGADGSITNVEIAGTNKVGGGCEDEAIRVIKKMPKWKPGRQNGQSVPVWFNLPIRFKINQ